MPTHIYITVISVIVFLFPPFRHYGKRFFAFFVILGMADVFTLVLIFFKLAAFIPYYLLISFATLVALFDWETIKKQLWLVILLFVFICWITFFSSNSGMERLLFLILHFFILLRIVHIMAIDLIKTGSLDAFYLVFIFYELLTLGKFFNILVKMTDVSVILNFYIVTCIQILIGIFFSFFTENDRRIRVKLE